MKLNRLHITEGFVFESGERLPELNLVYHTSDREYKKGDKVLWICHALTANSDPEEWWPQMVGNGRLFDPDIYFIVCVNILCSPYGSSGPASVNPDTGQPYLMTFPQTTVRDVVNANILVRKHLGIEKIDMLIGTSMGGFMSFEWAVMRPGIFGKIFFIATGARVTPWLAGFNAASRLALLADPTFKEHRDLNGGMEGLKAARAIALLTYRCEEGLFKQNEDSDDTIFAGKVGSYYRHQTSKFVKDWDAYSYLYVCDEVDSNNVGRGRGGVAAALSQIKTDCTFICMSSDELFPPEDMRPLSELIPGSRYRQIETPYGHDGFLIETAAIAEILAPAMP